MSLICKNCGAPLNGKFCVQCGQAADTHEINAHFLWHDIQHGLFHLDKGVLYSTKELFTRPGATIREYISGQRVKHFKPVSMLIVLAGIYGLLYHFFDISAPLSEEIYPAHLSELCAGGFVCHSLCLCYYARDRCRESLISTKAFLLYICLMT